MKTQTIAILCELLPLACANSPHRLGECKVSDAIIESSELPVETGEATQDVSVCLTIDDCGGDTVCHDGNCVPVVCEANTERCWMGLIQKCNEDGSAAEYLSCPKGSICDGSSCVANSITIYFSSGQFPGGPDNVPVFKPEGWPISYACKCEDGRERITCAVAEELKVLAPAQYSYQVPGWQKYVYGDIVLYERYVIRHLLYDLAGVSGFRYSLVHRPGIIGKPASEKFGSVFSQWINSYMISPATPAEAPLCIHGAVSGFQEFLDEVGFKEGIYAASNPCLPLFPSTEDSWFISNLGQILGVPAWGSWNEVSGWVDETVAVRSIGKSCAKDTDCETKLCIDENCVRVENLEVPGHLLDAFGADVLNNGQPMLLYTLNYIRLFGRVQGMACGNAHAIIPLVPLPGR